MLSLSFLVTLTLTVENVHGLKTQTFKATHEKKYKMKENYGQKGKTGSL